jgi:hypothetical protein
VWTIAPYVVAAAAVLVATLAVVTRSRSAEPSSAAPSDPRARGNDDLIVAETLDDLPNTVRPYPYVTPTPTPEPTEIDGTYMLILDLEELGGAKHALPFPCRRCLPYARDPGVSTLIFFRGEYFLHHQMSGFRSSGHYEVDRNRLSLFNDPNCSSVRGTYVWRLDETLLRLKVVEDPCAFEGERAIDLASDPWTKIPICRREVANL